MWLYRPENMGMADTTGNGRGPLARLFGRFWAHPFACMMMIAVILGIDVFATKEVLAAEHSDGVSNSTSLFLVMSLLLASMGVVRFLLQQSLRRKPVQQPVPRLPRR
jgi:hypothetical protein